MSWWKAGNREGDDNPGGNPEPNHSHVYGTFIMWVKCDRHSDVGVAQKYQCRCGGTELRNWRDCSKCAPTGQGT